MTTTVTANEAIVRGLIAAFGRGDLDAVAGFFSPDAVWDLPGRGVLAGTYTGPDEITGFLGRSAALSGGTLSIDVIDVLASEHGAAHLQRVTARRDGSELDCVEVLVHRIENGLITRTYHRPDAHAIDAFFAG